MVNPLGPAYDFFLGFFNSLPFSCQALVLVVIGLYVVSVIINLIMR